MKRVPVRLEQGVANPCNERAFPGRWMDKGTEHGGFECYSVQSCTCRHEASTWCKDTVSSSTSPLQYNRCCCMLGFSIRTEKEKRERDAKKQREKTVYFHRYCMTAAQAICRDPLLAAAVTHQTHYTMMEYYPPRNDSIQSPANPTFTLPTLPLPSSGNKTLPQTSPTNH